MGTSETPTPTSMHAQLPAAEPGVFSPGGICSAHPRLLKHYFILSLFTGPAVFIVFPILFFRYHTLRYRFDSDGVTMTVGILFRHEIALTYRRIQDIHVNRGIIQRWLGLATVACQTASGSSAPELVIEGLMEYEKVRDFLYHQMRGAKGDHSATAAPGTAIDPGDEALVLLTDIRDRVAALSAQVESLRANSKESPHGRTL